MAIASATDAIVAAALIAVMPLALYAQGGAHLPELNSAPSVRGQLPTDDPAGTLRVCADPNNMPFSNHARQGFENRIAQVLASELHDSVTYTWWAQRRGFIRSTLNAHLCDAIVGIVAGDGQVLTTRPYYRSTYVFVTRRDRNLDIASFDDDRLPQLRIGLHVIGADYNSLPPAVALARRHMIRNVKGYSIYGNYAEASPPSALIAAVARRDVDIAVAWGPLAGYYAAHSPVPLSITPVKTRFAVPGIPFTYDITIGVRHSDHALRTRLDRALARRLADIQRILKEYHVPVDAVGTATPALSAAAAVEHRGDT